MTIEVETIETVETLFPLDRLNSKLANWLASHASYPHGVPYFDAEGCPWVPGQYKPKRTSLQSVLESILHGIEFAGLYCAAFPFAPAFDIVSGDDIIESFSAKFRPGSCMREGSAQSCWEDVQGFLRVYSENPDKVAMLRWDAKRHAALNSSGSALIWIGSAGIFLDRTYGRETAPGFSVPFAQAIADYVSNVYEPKPVKVLHRTSTSERIPLDDAGKITFYLNFHGDRMPYCDSLKYASVDGDDLRVSNRSFDDSIECESTEGTDLTGEKAPKYRCCQCRTGLHEDEIHICEGYDDIYCDVCYSEAFAYDEYSQTDYPADSETYVKCYFGRYHQSPSVQEISISEDSLSYNFKPYGGRSLACDYIHNDYATETVEGTYVCEEDFIENDVPPTDTNADRQWVNAHGETDLVLRENAVWIDSGALAGAWYCVDILDSPEFAILQKYDDRIEFKRGYRLDYVFGSSQPWKMEVYLPSTQTWYNCKPPRFPTPKTRWEALRILARLRKRIDPSEYTFKELGQIVLQAMSEIEMQLYPLPPKPELLEV